MEKNVIFMVGLLFILGCANNSENVEPITQNDNSNSMVINKPEEQTMSKFEEAPTQGNNDRIRFERKSTLGRGDHIVVKKFVKVGPNHSQYKRLKGKPVLITVGWISEGRDGVYRYYEPKTNELNPTFTETDLEVLKDKIRSHLSNP